MGLKLGEIPKSRCADSFPIDLSVAALAGRQFFCIFLVAVTLADDEPFAKLGSAIAHPRS
jgi:hypothetical protein